MDITYFIGRIYFTGIEWASNQMGLRAKYLWNLQKYNEFKLNA